MSSFRFNFEPNAQTSSAMSENTNFKWFTFNTNLIPNLDKTIEHKEVADSEQIFSEQIISDNNARKPQIDHKLMDDSMLDSNASQLRSRVAQELEKIETWKAITEMNIKNKDERIEELVKECDELRRKIVIIENEKHSLDAKMSEERDERNEVIVKMNNTREMFFRINDYVASMEAKLKTFEEIESIIVQLNDERCQQFSDLCKNFDDLEMRYKNEVSVITQIIKERENEIFVIKQKMDVDINEKQIQLNEVNDELTKLKEEFNRSTNESNITISNLDIKLKKANEEKVRLETELSDIINGLNNQLHAKNNECEKIGIKMTEMAEEFTNLKLLHETSETTAEQNSNQLINQKNILEIQMGELTNCCENLKSEKCELEKRISELESNIETSEQTFIKEKLVVENQMKIQIDSLIADKESIELNKQSMTTEFEARIKELEVVIIEKNDTIDELAKTIDNLQTELARMKVEINERENVEKQLFNENEKLRSDFEMEEKERQSSARTLKDTNKELKCLKSKLDALIAEIETTKQEKKDLEQKLEREKRSLESQISNMGKILESCKTDYNLRIDDKETRIKELKQEVEKLTIDVNQLYKRNEKIEAEKAQISLKLHELTFSTLRPTIHSPIRVITPKKFLSPIERVRSTALSTGSAVDSLNPLLSESQQKCDNNDVSLQISAKQNGNQTIRQKRQSSQQKDEQLASLRKTKDIISKNLYELLENKEMISKEKRQKTVSKQTPKTSTRRQTSGSRAKAKARLDMSSVSQDIEYDTNKADFDKGLIVDKLISKTKINANKRFENIIKGLPTPNKTDDLSWLNF